MEALQGGTADHLLPCTASNTETCQIVSELVTWNKLLRGSRFEIREDPETCNQLCVTNSTTAPPMEEIFDTEQWPQYQKLLEWLLTTHRCIGSVSLRLSSMEDTSPSLLRAVCQNRWIKTLSIADIKTTAAAAVVDILPCLTSIEKLHLTPEEIPPDVFVAPVSTLLEASACLSSLHVSGKFAQGGTIDMLFTGLLRKPTLAELHFQDLSVHGDAYPQPVKEYLGSTTSLKVLSVTTRTPSMQMAVLEGVLENGSIEKLSLDLFRGTEEIMPLVSRVIKTKRAIRILNISRSVPVPPAEPSVYDCLVLPLIENDTLQEVGVPFYIFHSATGSALLRALPAKENLKMVRITSTCRTPQLHWLCAELKRSGAEEKVSLEGYSLTMDIRFLHCKAFSMANLSFAEYERKLAALVRLPNCQHLKMIAIYTKN
ncbi:hypothetical protein HPB52_014399 [Rhipicephalus sanguineus]|uniref:Uncharacterized protein n=1 Tax=Rhipicephalus sanguineus TaxID=34632 RepID=A0A9D4T7N2_RHISA|nr:hypothetical protein HPB52_014399 [Rhipicephalus sanguineus]